MDPDIPKTTTSLSHFFAAVTEAKFIIHIHWVVIFLFVAISRKRHVKEQLFNQILTELCARQCAKPNDIAATNTEYSDKFGNLYSKENDQPVSEVIFQMSLAYNPFFAFNWSESFKLQLQIVWWKFEWHQFLEHSNHKWTGSLQTVPTTDETKLGMSRWTMEIVQLCSDLVQLAVQHVWEPYQYGGIELDDKCDYK